MIKPIKLQYQLKQARSHWQLYLIFLLPFVYFVLFKYVPMYGLVLAFKKYRVSKGILGSPWVGLDHFIRFIQSPTSLQVMYNTFILSLYTIAASFPLSVILAVALNETRNKTWKKSVQMVTYAPYFISTVVMVAILFQLLDPRIGIINRFLEVMGLDTVNFMGEATWFRHIYVWSGVWQTTGYNAIIYLAALTSISPELYEAAIVDGANKVQRIRHIDIPGITPTIIIMLILNMGYVMSVGFEKSYLMQNPLNLETAEIMSTYVYRVGLLNTDYSFSTAIGLINSLINLILILGFNSFARKMGDTSLW